MRKLRLGRAGVGRRPRMIAAPACLMIAEGGPGHEKTGYQTFLVALRIGRTTSSSSWQTDAGYEGLGEATTEWKDGRWWRR